MKGIDEINRAEWRNLWNEMKKIDEWSERQLAGPRKQMKLINLWELIDWFCFCGVFDGFDFFFFIVVGYGRWHRQWLRRKRRRRKKSNSNQTNQRKRENEMKATPSGSQLEELMERQLLEWNERRTNALTRGGKPTFHSILLSSWRRRMYEMAERDCGKPFHQTNINFHSHSNLMFVFDFIKYYNSNW